MTNQPPPIGIMPERIWKEQRLCDLHAAVKRYIDAKIPVPDEWLWEMHALHRDLSPDSPNAPKGN
jgi:hypothetical protein